MCISSFQSFPRHVAREGAGATINTDTPPLALGGARRASAVVPDDVGGFPGRGVVLPRPRRPPTGDRERSRRRPPAVCPRPLPDGSRPRTLCATLLLNLLSNVSKLRLSSSMEEIAPDKLTAMLGLSDAHPGWDRPDSVRRESVDAKLVLELVKFSLIHFVQCDLIDLLHTEI